MTRRFDRFGRVGAGTGLLVVLLAGACGGSEPEADSSTTTTEAVVVAPDYDAPLFNARVNLTEDGVEPETLYLPAGRRVRLVVFNRTEVERHYRVAGLLATEIFWLQEPEYTLFELEQLPPEEQAAIGFDPDETDEAHIEHHLTPTFVPTKGESPSGIKPLPNEVHGWADGHSSDIMMFIPLVTGRYVAEDVLHPGEWRAEVVVFVPSAGTTEEG